MIRPKILNDREKGFLECFIDTDGSIIFQKTKYNISIGLVFYNNSKKLLDKVQKILRTNRNYIITKTIVENNSYQLRYSSNLCRWVLPQLKLVFKEDKRKLALRILSCISSNRSYSFGSLSDKRYFLERLKEINENQYSEEESKDYIDKSKSENILKYL